MTTMSKMSTLTVMMIMMSMAFVTMMSDVVPGLIDVRGIAAAKVNKWCFDCNVCCP